MSDDPQKVLNDVELFSLSHAVATDNALNVLVQALYDSRVIDEETVQKIRAVYRRPLDDSENPLSASVRTTQDKAFGHILGKPKG